MDILVVSPCSSDKCFDEQIPDSEKPGCEAVDEQTRETLLQQDSDFVKPAATMYTGDEHQHVKDGVDKLREISNVDWHIISAGFGLLQDDTEIPVYECGFSEIEDVRLRATRLGYDLDCLTNDETIQAVAREKGIPQSFRQLLDQEYDLLFVVLSKPYLLSITEVLSEIQPQTTAFALASEGSKHLVGDCHWIPATETERSALGTTWMRLRGNLFRTFTQEATIEQLQNITERPSMLTDHALGASK